MNEINLSDLLADIHVLDKELATFEAKYGLLSEAFYDWYTKGHEPEDDSLVMDLTEWAGVYKSRQRLVGHYRQVLTQQLAKDRLAINHYIQKQGQVNPI